MNQQSFFDIPEPAPYQAHSPTSREAADAIAPTAGTLRAKVLAYMRVSGLCTDEQMQLGIPMAASTQRPRRGELVAAGLVRDSGKTGLTIAGRKAVLWEVTDAGR